MELNRLHYPLVYRGISVRGGDQYWSAVEVVQVTICYQYWLQIGPVLLHSLTSTGSYFPSLLLVRSTSLTAWYGLLYVWALFDRDSYVSCLT